MIYFMTLGFIALVAAIIICVRRHYRPATGLVPTPPQIRRGHHRRGFNLTDHVWVDLNIPNEIPINGMLRIGERPASDNPTPPLNNWEWLLGVIGVAFFLAGIVMYVSDGSDSNRSHMLPVEKFPRPDQMTNVDQSTNNVDKSVTNTSVTKNDIVIKQVMNAIAESNKPVLDAIKGVNDNLNSHRAGARASHAQAIEQRSEILAGIFGIRAELALAREELARALAAFQAAKKTGDYRTELQRLDEANQAINELNNDLEAAVAAAKKASNK